MIPGDKTRRIVGYLPFGCSYAKPKEGEDFIGIPWGYYHENEPAFIQVRNGSHLVRTVNTTDLSKIDFADDETVNP